MKDEPDPQVGDRPAVLVQQQDHRGRQGPRQPQQQQQQQVHSHFHNNGQRICAGGICICDRGLSDFEGKFFWICWLVLLRITVFTNHAFTMALAIGGSWSWCYLFKMSHTHSSLIWSHKNKHGCHYLKALRSSKDMGHGSVPCWP